MKKILISVLAVMILSAAVLITIGTAAGEKSAKEICFRKCSEQMDKCFDKPGMTRLKCAKQNEECEKGCDEMLK